MLVCLDFGCAGIAGRLKHARRSSNQEHCAMPRLTVEGARSVNVPQGKRLVNALEDEAAIDQLHACGGVARRTPPRAGVIARGPPETTPARKSALTPPAVISPP